MPKTVNVDRSADGEVMYNTDEKLFEDIRANPGEQAFVFIHTVPYEGSVALVNLLTSTRLVRKGFDVNIILYGPGVLLASGTRGFPAVGQEAFPGHMAINNQIKTLIKEGASIYACRFAKGALYGFREDDLIEGVQPFHPRDVLDSALTAWRAGAFQINTWTVWRTEAPRGRPGSARRPRLAGRGEGARGEAPPAPTGSKPDYQATAAGSLRDVDTPPRFNVGDRVKVKEMHPVGH